ncbi:MAG: nucleoside triphosphate pyrophosphohydrolase, partial [Firmicutes bacterium]|nr:nucleoside triphosphate pyrophosphohydrolase [Bacillota bacterium]
MEYQKLVRDKIPELIAAGGETPVIRVLEDGEYLSRLEDKLEEEVAEYRQSGEPEELADILEVVYAL